MNLKIIIILSLFCMLSFCFNLSFASIDYEDEQNSDIFFLPDCDGLLPDNYEYFEFLEKIAIGLIMQNTPSSLLNAEKIYILLSLRNSRILAPEDQMTKNTAKTIDSLLAEKLCSFAYGKNRNNLWSSSPLFISWAEANIDNLINETKHNLALHIKVMKEIELSQKRALHLNRKMKLLSDKGKREANKILSRLK